MAAAVVDEQRAGRTALKVDLKGVFDRGGERLQGVAATFPRDTQNAVTLLVAKVLDVAGERLVDAQAVVRQQRDRAADRGLSASAAASSCSSSSRVRPTVIESLETLGRLTFATEFSSRTPTSTP